MISNKVIEKFKKVVSEEYGKELTHEEAGELLSGLVEYYDLLAELNYRLRGDKEVL